MTWTRDLVWQNIEQIERSSVAYQFARYALSLDYKLLPQDVVHQAKRCLLDTLGCAIGAYEAPGRPICESLAQALRGPEEATVFGSGLRTSAPNATLVNCFMVRFLDFNDSGGGGHNSDTIPAILAVAEREKSNGRDFLTSVVISYELGRRVREAVHGGVEDPGWQPDERVTLNIPPALGKLMGMTEEQIANAIGACACHEHCLYIVDADREENKMSKNLRVGWPAYNAILTCLLAKEGFTGPVRVIEGDKGINQILFRGEMDFERLTDFSGWRILKTEFKVLPLMVSIIGHTLAILAIVNEHPIKPEDVASVRIWAYPHEAMHTTVHAKKYPRNAESADHSSPWATAMAIRDRSFTAESYRPENFNDPVILDLIEKITVIGDPSFPTREGGAAEITTKDGHIFKKRFEGTHGLGKDPLTDAEIEDKVRKMATKYMSERQIKQIIDTVWNVEKLDDMGKLAKLMVFQSK